MRLFVGLALSDEANDALERVTLRLRAKDDGLRWSTREQWHVTLVFLGEVGDDARARLVHELRELRLPALTLRMDGLGVFERAGILHAAVEVTPELLRAYEQTAAAVRRAGVAVEDRPYRAHVTLARARNRAGRTTIERMRRSVDEQRLTARWRAEELLLYQSQLSPAGSSYVVRERFPMAPE